MSSLDRIIKADPWRLSVVEFCIRRTAETGAVATAEQALTDIEQMQDYIKWARAEIERLRNAVPTVSPDDDDWNEDEFPFE